MKTAILIHGYPTKEEYFNPEGPSSSNRHWFPWLQKKLIIHGINTETPEMPDAYEPDYEKWRKKFEQFPFDKETVLIGHSCGGGFLVRWLSEHDVQVGKVILVAPWLDPEKELVNGFFDFQIDQNLVKKTKELVVFYSTDDYDYIIQSVDILKQNISNTRYVTFSDKRHFCYDDMGTDAFPELLAEALV